MRVWKRVYRRLLGVLAVARAALTAERLLVLAELEDQREDAVDAVTLLGQFLVEDDHGIRFCHLTLAEFLIKSDREDWYVDAALNHERIADRLITEHGGSWSSCEDEYALSHTVTHLVAAGRRRADRLTALLGDPAFGVAKCLRLGAGPMLRDYLDAHTTLPERPEIAEGLAETLARLADHGVPGLAGTLHAVVGYRTDAAEFYKDVLGLLIAPGYLERFVDDETRRAASLIEFSQAEVARLRRTGDVDDVAEARQVLLRAVAGRDVDTLTSAICYELGYLDFLCGEPEKSLAWLENSVEAAERAGDRVGRHISRLVAMKVGLRSGAVSPSAYRSAHEEALAFFQDAEAEGPHVERWMMAAHSHLLDLGLWTDDAGLITSSLRALEENPWIRKHRRDDLLTMARARAAAGTGDWDTACSLFEIGLDGVPSHREELARDLFYYGISLARTGDNAKAAEVWEQGLNTPDNAANWPWRPRIADAVAAL